MAKRTITTAEYQQLLGLMFLAIKHDETMQEITRAAMALVGEEEGPYCNFGHTGDAMDGSDGSPIARVEELLRKLKITIAKTGQQESPSMEGGPLGDAPLMQGPGGDPELME